jgi:predicted hydrolase (HD superfamily)
MNTQEMLKNAIGIMKLNIMNPAEMPVDQALQAVTAIAALAQADALTRIAAVMEANRGDVEREYYRQELRSMLDDEV